MMSPPSQKNTVTLAIRRIGLVTSLGEGAVTVCAAARAGLSRSRLLDEFPVWNSQTCELELTSGHPVDRVTRGFEGVGRLLRLGGAALDDLLAGVDVGALGRTALIVTVRSDGLFSRSLIAPWPDAPPVAPKFRERVLQDVAERQANLSARLLPRLALSAGLDLAAHRSRLIFGGEAGFVTAVEAAAELLASGTADSCVVGGIDTQLEAESLSALHRLGMLKTPDQPNGRVPGEGAGFVLLTSPARPSTTPDRPLGILRTWASARERSEEWEAGARPRGEALAASLEEVLATVPARERPDVVISDLTGEDSRAFDWANAALRLRSRLGFAAAREWIPALAFGAIGAASGPAAACMACRGLARGYAGPHGVVAWLSSEDGTRAAFTIGPAENVA